MLLPAIVSAQIDPPPDPVDGVPFDGGLSVLIGAGVLYGIKKARDAKRQRQHQDE